MLAKLTYKVVLEYFIDNKKVTYYSEISNDGLATNTISIGNDRVSETTINGRVLSGESTINVITSGYEYVYDNEGVTIDLKQKNPNVAINDSVTSINTLKNSKEFFKAKMDGILASNNSAEFIACSAQTFFVYKEVTLSDDKNAHTYFLQQNFTSNNKSSKLESEEENYQINEDFISLTTDFKNNIKKAYCNIDGIEIEEIDQDDPMHDKIRSMIDTLTPLKELSNSNPKTYKDLKMENKNDNTKKTIR